MAIFLGVLGGLGLFLYGMHIMSSSLQRAAGDKLRDILSLLTSNRILSVIVGAVITMIVQSSSATTVMVVGFVNAGLMTLSQSIGVIMGANVGTTFTALIISLDLNELAPVIVGFAVAIWLFSNNRKIKQIAEAFIGFGILFIGMGLMSDALYPLRDSQAFIDLVANFADNPILGVFAGFAITIAVQSSTASTAIVLALASQGVIQLDAAIPVLLGANLGTTVTAILSSIGANINAKKAAMTHFIFNFVGAMIFIIFFRGILQTVVEYIAPGDTEAIIRKQIAATHIIFNVTSTLMLLPFADLIVKLANRLIPGEDKSHEGIKYIDIRLLETPSVALNSAIKESLHMGNVVKLSFEKAMNSFENGKESDVKEAFQIEKTINQIEKDLSNYLVKLSNTNISMNNRELINGLFNTINDIERVGDHADNIAELSLFKIENNIKMTTEASEELKYMSSLAFEAYEKSLTAMKNLDQDLAYEVLRIENKIDETEKKLRNNHINRLNSNKCDTTSGIIFLDTISNLERIGDHSSNIAYAVLDQVKIEKKTIEEF